MFTFIYSFGLYDKFVPIFCSDYCVIPIPRAAYSSTTGKKPFIFIFNRSDDELRKGIGFPGIPSAGNQRYMEWVSKDERGVIPEMDNTEGLIILKEEFRKLINSLTFGKAPGDDEISIEML